MLVTAAFGGIAGNVMQHGLMFTPDKLKPEWSKLSPLSGFKRIFGPDGLFQFGKSIAKILAVTAVAWWVLKPHMHEFKGLSALDPAAMLPFSAEILRQLVFAVLALMLVITGGDWLWQRQRFLKKMRMSREEVKEEFKQTDGDPMIKAKLRQLRHEKSRRRMMQAVPEATVVVMNPTHYAVALKYEAGAAAAPECVAKGLDAVALKIRAIAEENGVPVVEDPPHGHLALVRVTGMDGGEVRARIEALAHSCRRDASRTRGEDSLDARLMVLGPAPAPIERVNRRYRWQLLLRAEDRPALRWLLGRLRAGLGPQGSGTRATLASVDVDPHAMM